MKNKKNLSKKDLNDWKDYLKNPTDLIETPGNFIGPNSSWTQPFQNEQKFREWSTKMPVEWKGIPGYRSAFISPEDWKHAELS